MSAECYAESIRRLLASEGGYVNHPSDPGGPTNFGITLGDYRKYLKAGVYVSGRTREKQTAITREDMPSIVGTVIKAVARKR